MSMYDGITFKYAEIDEKGYTSQQKLKLSRMLDNENLLNGLISHLTSARM